MVSRNFTIEISGVAVGFARQVLGLDGIPSPATGGRSRLGAGSPVNVAGADARFGGQYYVNPVKHNYGGGSAPPGGRVILLGVVPADQHGAVELSRWWGQKDSPQLGRRPVAIVQRDSSGRELRRHTMDGWLLTWQGPPPLPGRPDPPPETARVEFAAANVRLGR